MGDSPAAYTIFGRKDQTRGSAFREATDKMAEKIRTGIDKIASNEAEIETAISKISDAKAILASVRDFTDILKIQDLAVAVKAWAGARGADEAAMFAVEVKLRAERKAGEFLAGMKKEGVLSKGGGDQRSDHREQNVTSVPTDYSSASSSNYVSFFGSYFNPTRSHLLKHSILLSPRLSKLRLSQSAKAG